MNTFIVILVSLLLGYWMGWKHKKKKWKKYEKETEEQILKLTQDLDNQKHRNKLSMYRSDYRKKYDVEYFQQSLMKYASTKSKNKEECTVFYSLIEFMRNNGTLELDRETIFNVDVFNTSLCSLQDALKNIAGNPKLKVNTYNQSMDLDLKECIVVASSFVKSMHLESYSISYQSILTSIMDVLELLENEI